jgi:histidinol phosphatase-like enzyme
MMKTYVIDIDGTICTKTEGHGYDYSTATPYSTRIEHINRLYADGNTIIYFTARGMGRSKDNTAIAYEECYEVTKQQLTRWGAKFHRLVLGKPYADFYIDDKGINDIDFFNDELPQ